MDLYGFGFNGHGVFPPPIVPDSPFFYPVTFLHAQCIKILWTSWCDALVMYHSPGEHPHWTVFYTGKGELVHKNIIRDLEPLINDADLTVRFFGEKEGKGLVGYFTFPTKDEWDDSTTTCETMSDEPQLHLETTVTILFPDTPRRIRQPHGMSTIDARLPPIRHIAIASNGTVSVATLGRRQTIGPGKIQIASPELWHFASKDALLEYINYNGKYADKNNDSLGRPRIINKIGLPRPMSPGERGQYWKQVVANRITTTALSSAGKVYTYSRDRRFPTCLGRAATPGDQAQFDTEKSLGVVTYLEETKIVKIASGGYVTFALSADGEVFSWGYKRKNIDDPAAEDDDEYVREEVRYSRGYKFKALDIAVGDGHALVAVSEEQETNQRRVFARGYCLHGQLGIQLSPIMKESVDEWIEVPIFRGKKVVGMEAAGHTSWVIVENQSAPMESEKEELGVGMVGEPAKE